MEQKQALSGLQQQLAANQNQLVEARSSLGQLPTLMAQKVQALRNELSTAEQRIAEIKGRGVLLKADIILEKRPLISWLTNPLRSVRM